MNTYVSNAAGMAALFDVWAAFEEHATELGELSLPVPVQITASGTATDGRAVLSAQLRGGNLAQLAAGLLAWADTLTGVTVWFWCSGEGSLHLYVYGRLTCDRLIQVWGVADLPASLAHDESRFAVEIDLARLRRWAAGVSL